ncbi:50S ribosomal protein L10 [Numidum massiliense]|uniref:50S ribosomal protein L10 n=1 Tax=Numidum massiliense TaxID=1522315 RepID=UPI0006D52DAD|nr:50S ribosomal protein L10 [Numidum massiliense]
MTRAVIEEKKKVVAGIVENLKNSKVTILADYRGLNVAEVTELRKQLRDAGIEYKVLKNTMMRRATAETGFTDLDQHLVGPTAVTFGRDDVVEPAKILHKFAKEHEALEIKGGILEGQYVTVEQIEELAELPSYEGLLSMLLSVLQAPIRNVALAVKAVADQQEQGDAAEA